MTIVSGSAKAGMLLVVRPMTEVDKITALQKIGKLVCSGDSLLVYDNERVRWFMAICWRM